MANYGIQRHEGGVFLENGAHIVPGTKAEHDREAARKATLAWSILQDHSRSGSESRLEIFFDALASHDITYVGVIQTARASGLEEFPLPYVLTNCHNTLAAVGGTINEDDHAFGLSAARKYGGIFVPPHMAVIHQYMREMMSGCGRMILGSDSHTRYGALGTMAVGEGGPELVKQLLGRPYDVGYPPVVLVYLTGDVRPGVGPQDVALSLIGDVFPDGFVKNTILEFTGPGVEALSVDFRNGIDVMTTETTCLSSIWKTDDKVKDYYAAHGRETDYRELNPGPVAYYDKAITVDLTEIRPMIALPFHPSNVMTVEEFLSNPWEALERVEDKAEKIFGSRTLYRNLKQKIKNDGVYLDQGVIAGCAGGTFENIMAASDILARSGPGNGQFSLSVYPSSQPVYMELIRQGAVGNLMKQGVIMRSAFCGPCFGAGDVPVHEGLSIRHTTRNFPNREGSKPGDGQAAGVALMDARSIAATAANKGYLIPATEVVNTVSSYAYTFNPESYDSRVGNFWKNRDTEGSLKYGPGIKDWPEMPALSDHLVIEIASVITDPVTTTDELIPSGETSSYRSNPERLAQFTLSRKDPGYVDRARTVREFEYARRNGEFIPEGLWAHAFEKLASITTEEPASLTGKTGIGSLVAAVKPGDGSAREQAASCQKVLGGWANVARDYATKRYRSNLINWGMLPFIYDDTAPLGNVGDLLVLPGIRKALEEGCETLTGYIISASGNEAKAVTLGLPGMTESERQIILSGCLINHYAGE
ncbi:MAG: hydratase [Spirochaetales bacterium]|nr:hydratase [Spirochaetales bacterium]